MRTKHFPRICGVSEVADLLEIRKQNVKYVRTHKDFPEPIQTLACGPIWLEDDIVNYKSKTKDGE